MNVLMKVNLFVNRTLGVMCQAPETQGAGGGAETMAGAGGGATGGQ